MDLELPLGKLKLIATSVADDLGFVALADVASIVERQSLAGQVRLIGGHMVTLHAQRWTLGRELYRETLDADLGVQKYAMEQLDPLVALAALGYQRTSGNTFERRVDDVSSTAQGTPETSKALIDVLVPSHRSRSRSNVRVGDLATTEVPGLATAFQHQAVTLQLDMHRLNGDVLRGNVSIPDEACTLVLKALAWKIRVAPKDAVDMWRCLEIAHRAQADVPALGGSEATAAVDAVQEGFATVNAAATKALAAYQNLNAAALKQRHTRIRALMKALF